MSSKRYIWRATVLALVCMWICAFTAFAEGASDDNSLASLGITTEGAVVSPEFSYGTVEYEVTVPLGTSQLSLDPQTSDANARIVEITGTELENGEATTVITVEAENGSAYSYYLHVKADASAGSVVQETEPQTETESQTETETEPETEDPRYVRVDRNSLQEAANTIDTLKGEASDYRDRVGLLTKILYGMIAFSVVLLFIVINLILKKKDMKNELENYRSYGYGQELSGGGFGAQEDAYEASGKKKKSRKKDKKNSKKAKMQEFDSQAGYGAPEDQNGYYDTQEYGGGQEGYYDTPEYGSQEAYEAQNRGGENSYDVQNYESSEGYSDGGVMDDVKDVQAAQKKAAAVPKPSRAHRKAKNMPQYEEMQTNAVYQTKQENASDNVEIDMIDL